MTTRTAKLRAGVSTVAGYGTTIDDHSVFETAPDTTTEDYGRVQQTNNVRVTREYVEPLLNRLGLHSAVDIGCGVGQGVLTLLEDGFDAYGVDLPGLVPHWNALGCPADRFFVVAPDSTVLPFEDGAVDFAYSFGVIEHIGTSDGHSSRRRDYHEARRAWLREAFRTVRVGGYVLVGGPNRNFPLDFSHGLDAAGTRPERWLSAKARVSVHRTWGEYFLWSYRDIPRYLDGLSFEMTPLSIRKMLVFGRVPSFVRPLAHLYIDHLPNALQGTGCNPWVMALIKKTA